VGFEWSLWVELAQVTGTTQHWETTMEQGFLTGLNGFLDLSDAYAQSGDREITKHQTSKIRETIEKTTPPNFSEALHSILEIVENIPPAQFQTNGVYAVQTIELMMEIVLLIPAHECIPIVENIERAAVQTREIELHIVSPLIILESGIFARLVLWLEKLIYEVKPPQTASVKILFEVLSKYAFLESIQQGVHQKHVELCQGILGNPSFSDCWVSICQSLCLLDQSEKSFSKLKEMILHCYYCNSESTVMSRKLSAQQFTYSISFLQLLEKRDISGTIPANLEYARAYYTEAVFQIMTLPVEVLEFILEYCVDGFEHGQQTDVLDSKGCWCAGEVAGCDQEDQVLVHFLGYSSVYDEFISTTSSRLAPAFTFTKVEPEESAVGLNLLESFPIEPIMAL
jgi:hypothetical protein